MVSSFKYGGHLKVTETEFKMSLLKVSKFDWSEAKKSASAKIINLIFQKLEEINTVDWSLIGWLEQIIYHWLNTISSSWYNWKKWSKKIKFSEDSW